MDDPRQLTEREREILTFLLGADFPGVEKLRAQANTARVIGACDCGCATVYLEVDPSLPTADEVTQTNAVDATGLPRAGSAPLPDLILFVKDGRLSSVEIIWYGEAPVRDFPPPSEFGAPQALWWDADKA
jgi:hypothetical protein